MVGRETAAGVYEETEEVLSCDADVAALPYPSGERACPDLRGALNKLQYGWCCSEIVAGDMGTMEDAENRSYVDGYLERRTWDVLEVSVCGVA